MDTPLEIAFHNTEPSEALEAKIRDRAEKLHRYFNHINSVHVIVDMPHRSQHNKLAYHVTVEVRVPGKEIVVSRDPGAGDHFDPYLAVRDAFDAMDRRLEGFSQTVRGDVKTLDTLPQGRILRLFPDYGFIETTDGQEIYFHRNAVQNDGFDALEKDQTVELSIIHGADNGMGPQATLVRPIGQMQMSDEVPSRT